MKGWELRSNVKVVELGPLYMKAPFTVPIPLTFTPPVRERLLQVTVGFRLTIPSMKKGLKSSQGKSTRLIFEEVAPFNCIVDAVDPGELNAIVIVKLTPIGSMITPGNMSLGACEVP